MSQVYMTAKLNLADGTILYPQVSLDNIVASISDPTLVTVATTTNGKVPVTELPVVTVVGDTGSNNNIPTEAAVRALADTKQNTLVAGTGTEIINGSTINAMAVNLNDVVVNNVPNNGLYLEVEGNTMSVVAGLAANDSAGVIAGASDGVKLVNGVAQFDNDTVDAATPMDITGGTANKVIQADDLDTALTLSGNILPSIADIFKEIGPANYNGIVSGTLVYSYDGDTVLISGTKKAGVGSIYIMPNKWDMFRRKAGSWLVTCDVYLETSGLTHVRLCRASSTAELTAVSGSTIPRRTSTVGEWVRIGGRLDQTGANNNVGLFWEITAPSTSDFPFAIRIRNMRAVVVSDVPQSAWATWQEDGNYVYEPGSGVKIDGKKIAVDEASPSSVLAGVTDKAITPNSMKSTFSVGQAVDCTAVPSTDMTFVDLSGGTATMADSYRDTFGLTTSTATTGTRMLGFYSPNYYPKAADLDLPTGKVSLKYLFICDIVNKGTEPLTLWADGSVGTGTADTTLSMLRKSVAMPAVNGVYTKTRVAFCFKAKMNEGVTNTSAILKMNAPASSVYNIEISNLRQFEVNALTDDAIEYLAGVENPDDADSLYMIKNDMVDPWVNIIDMGAAPAVTLASGLAYKSTVASGSTCTFSTDTIPVGTYGKDAHLTLFVGQGSTVIFQPPLNLLDPLTPNSGHNITIKYRDGQANAYVDDTDIGYVVTVTAGTESGSLYYGMKNVTDSNYVVFSNALDGQPIVLDTSIALDTSNPSKTMVGNGISETIIDLNQHAISADYGSLSGKTLAITNMTITNGKNTYSTISVAGDLRIANTVISNSVATYFGGGVHATSSSHVYLSGTTITGCTTNQVGGAISTRGSATLTISDSLFCDNKNLNARGGAIWSDSNGLITISGSTFARNTGLQGAHICLEHATASISSTLFTGALGGGGAIFFGNSSTNSIVSVSDCTFETDTDKVPVAAGNTVSFAGTNIVNARIYGAGTITVAKDTTFKSTTGTGSIDRSNTTQHLSIAGALTFENMLILGTSTVGAVVYGGAVDCYQLTLTGSTISNSRASNGAGGYVAGSIQITNSLITGNTTSGGYGGGLQVILNSARSTAASFITGSTFSNNKSVNGGGGGINIKDYSKVGEHPLTVSDCVFTNNNANYSGGAVYGDALHVTFENCTFTNNLNGDSGAILLRCNLGTGTPPSGPAKSVFKNCYFDSNTGIFAKGIDLTISYWPSACHGSTCEIVGSTFTRAVGSICFSGYGTTITVQDSKIGSLQCTGETAASNQDMQIINFIGANTVKGGVSGNNLASHIEADGTFDMTGNANNIVIQGEAIVVGSTAADGWTVGGSANLVNTSGTSSSLSGIGTYINKDGSNDFAAPYEVVTGSGTGTGTLYDGLTTSTSPKRFILLDTDSDTVTASIDTAITGRTTTFTTSEGVPIVAGTFTIPADSTVSVAVGRDENNKIQLWGSTVDGTVYSGSTVGIGSTGTVSVANLVIPGNYDIGATTIVSGYMHGVRTFSTVAKKAGSSEYYYSFLYTTGSTISNLIFDDTRVASSNALQSATLNYCTFKGSKSIFGRLQIGTSTVSVANCTFSNTDASVTITIAGGKLTLTDTVFTTSACIDHYGGVVVVSGCTISGAEFGRTGRALVIQDTNTFNGDYHIVDSGGGLTVYIIAGSTVKVQSTWDVPFQYVTAIKVGTFSDTNTYPDSAFVEGGTATIILRNNSVHHIEGHGTYIQSVITGGTFSDLTEID